MKAATALINRRALRHNLQRVKEIAPNSQMIAVVKANAYGHGLVGVGQAVEELVDGFGVARLNEALLLRQHGVIKPIVLLEGFFEQSDLLLMAEHQIDTVIHCIEQLEMLEATKLPYPLKVWMKLDTGMHRLGILPKDAEGFYQRLQRCQQVQLPINIVSHFCQADAPIYRRLKNKLPALNSLLTVKRVRNPLPPPQEFYFGQKLTMTGFVQGS